MRSIQFLHRHRTVLLAVLLAQFTLYNPGAARAERLTPQLHLQRAQLDAPVVSPDGQYAAFIVSRLDSATDSSNSSLWLLELETGEYRQLTHAGNVSDLAWDGDGGAIYFKRQQQVWRLPLTGGEAVTVTAVPGGIGSYRINPNRNAPPAARMLFTKDMSPDCPPTDWDCLDAVKKARKAAPGMATEALPLRHWNRWRTDLEGAVYLGDPATGNWRLVTACDGPREPLALASGAEISFSPDGARIAVIRNPDLGTQTALSTDNNIYLLETDAVLAATDSIAPWDTATLLSQGLSEGGGNDDNPVFSPDGRWLAYTSMKRAGCESDLRLINLYNLATGEERCLTCGLDRSAGGLTWSRDSRYLYFGAYDRESTALYRVEISGGKIERLLRSGSLSGVTALADGNLLLLLGSSRMPSELFLCDPDALAAAPEQWQADLALCVDGRFGVPDSATSDSASTEPESSLSALRQLTFFNRDWLEPLKMNPPDHFWFIGARDDAVHGFIIRPPAETTESEQNPVPLVMVFHGGPQWAYHDFWLQSYNFQMIAAAGYAVAVINFHGSTGFGYDFQDGIRGHWGDVPEEDVLRGLDYIVTPLRLCRQHSYCRHRPFIRRLPGELAQWKKREISLFRLPLRLL